MPLVPKIARQQESGVQLVPSQTDDERLQIVEGFHRRLIFAGKRRSKTADPNCEEIFFGDDQIQRRRKLTLLDEAHDSVETRVLHRDRTASQPAVELLNVGLRGGEIHLFVVVCNLPEAGWSRVLHSGAGY